MMNRPWSAYLSDTDRLVIEKGGYGQSRGLGVRPLLLVIDAQYNYVGRDVPIGAQLDEWPAGGGASAWAAVRQIAPLLQMARTSHVPVLYTRNVQKQTLAFDGFSFKTRRNQAPFVDGHRGTRIVSELEPAPGELVVDKAYASAFYGTPLQSYLVGQGIDTLLIVGGTTSGCCRATAVDGVTRNYRVAVVEDCVFDRVALSHAAALLDLWMKYCDVVKSDAVIDYLRARSGVFEPELSKEGQS